MRFVRVPHFSPTARLEHRASRAQLLNQPDVHGYSEAVVQGKLHNARPVQGIDHIQRSESTAPHVWK